MDIDDEDDPVFLDPEADMYEAMLEILDEGRLPFVAFIRPGLCYYRSYSVEDWSLVKAGTPTERQECIVQVMQIVFEEGVDADS